MKRLYTKYYHIVHILYTFFTLQILNFLYIYVHYYVFIYYYYYPALGALNITLLLSIIPSSFFNNRTI